MKGLSATEYISRWVWQGAPYYSTPNSGGVFKVYIHDLRGKGKVVWLWLDGGNE